MSEMTHLDPIDRISLELANERVLHSQAEARAAAALVDVANLRAHLVRIEVSHKYGLVEGDHMNFDTGAITRKPKPETPAEPTLALIPSAAQS